MMYRGGNVTHLWQIKIHEVGSVSSENRFTLANWWRKLKITQHRRQRIVLGQLHTFAIGCTVPGSTNGNNFLECSSEQMSLWLSPLSTLQKYRPFSRDFMAQKTWKSGSERSSEYSGCGGTVTSVFATQFQWRRLDYWRGKCRTDTRINNCTSTPFIRQISEVGGMFSKL